MFDRGKIRLQVQHNKRRGRAGLQFLQLPGEGLFSEFIGFARCDDALARGFDLPGGIGHAQGDCARDPLEFGLMGWCPRSQ